MLQIAIICGLTLIFFVLERLLPGRALPEAPGWYVRALFLNACQLGIVLLAGVAWNHWFQGHSLFHLSHVSSQLLQGFTGWFIGTFVFYWWHRARHDVNILWRVCHQVHHSPARIEMLTAFYKHPVEIAADSVIMSFLMFSLLGASLGGAAWFNVFAVFGEYFYHSNLRTPHWLGYFLLFSSFVFGATAGGLISMFVNGTGMLVFASAMCTLATAYTYFHQDRRALLN